MLDEAFDYEIMINHSPQNDNQGNNFAYELSNGNFHTLD